MIKNYLEAKREIQKSKTDNIYISSDLLRTVKLPYPPNRTLLDAHCELLIGLEKNILMPVFNYDFLTSGVFSLERSPSQVGVINEHFRTTIATWRTPVPVFSVSGNGELPPIYFQGIIDPFDEKSIFEYLYKTNSLILYYGANFSVTTLIHYVERISKKLVYRYDKYFHGKIISDCSSELITLKYHVRPAGYELDYDWNRLEKDLINQNILRCFDKGVVKIRILNVKDLVDFWLERFNCNRLYFLTKESEAWVKPLLDKLGRSFLLSDFE